MEPEKLRTDIERFFVEMGIPENHTFYSSSYFGMLDLYLGNGIEIYIRTTAYSIQQGRSVSRQIHRRLTMTRLARMNFSRNRKKAIITALSLSLTGILFLCISACANSVDVNEMAQSQFGDRSQYLLKYEDYAGPKFYGMQKENPLGQALQEELAAIPGVDFVTDYSMACVEIPAISETEGNREHEAFVVRGIILPTR